MTSANFTRARKWPGEWRGEGATFSKDCSEMAFSQQPCRNTSRTWFPFFIALKTEDQTFASVTQHSQEEIYSDLSLHESNKSRQIDKHTHIQYLSIRCLHSCCQRNMIIIIYRSTCLCPHRTIWHSHSFIILINSE